MTFHCLCNACGVRLCFFLVFLKSCLNWKDTEAWIHIQVGNDFDGYYLEQRAEQVYSYFIIVCIIFVVIIIIFICVDVHILFNLYIFCEFIWQTEKNTYTHDINSNQQANRQGLCVAETKTITHGFEMLFFTTFVTCHERATVWLFHVGASPNYCVSYLSSRRSDSGKTMQVKKSQTWW